MRKSNLSLDLLSHNGLNSERISIHSVIFNILELNFSYVEPFTKSIIPLKRKQASDKMLDLPVRHWSNRKSAAMCSGVKR